MQTPQPWNPVAAASFFTCLVEEHKQKKSSVQRLAEAVVFFCVYASVCVCVCVCVSIPPGLICCPPHTGLLEYD